MNTSGPAPTSAIPASAASPATGASASTSPPATIRPATRRTSRRPLRPIGCSAGCSAEVRAEPLPEERFRPDEADRLGDGPVAGGWAEGVGGVRWLGEGLALGGHERDVSARSPPRSGK
ncbi:hypothetical protein GCM10020220_017660 [Nonomuraea rubra]